MVHIHSPEAVERLREVVLDLERAKASERSLRLETAALLEGLRAIAEAQSSVELFTRLLGALRSPLAADVALVLCDPDGDGRTLSVTASTDPAFTGAAITPGRTLLRALGGRVTTLADTAPVPELQVAPFDRIGSVVLLPLAGEHSRALFVFGSHVRKAFAPHHEHLVRRMMPLANQALRDAERSETITRAHAELQAEVAERRRVETELRLAQKLEAVGKLASGIAHEINTPIQFVGDSLFFLRDAYRDVRSLLDVYQKAFRELAQTGTALAASLEQAEAAADLGYLDDNTPAAFARTDEGINRVATLVRAMKAFGAPEQCERRVADVNQALSNTITIAGAQYRNVANVVTELGDIQSISCFENELNQVFLNLIVNAAHAIADAQRGTLGEIRIRTWQDDRWLHISVRDDGVGIPKDIRDRIFELFFTTKDVGRGTGQGLAISREIVAKHGGKITVESEVGAGSTFEVWLPLS